MEQQFPIKLHNFFLASFSPTVAEHCCGREGLLSDSLKLDVSELMLRVISLTVDCKFQPLYFNFLIETKNEWKHYSCLIPPNRQSNLSRVKFKLEHGDIVSLQANHCFFSAE